MTALLAELDQLRARVIEADRDKKIMAHDYPILQAFHTKHALGALSAPSCLNCGKSTRGVGIGVQHMELPAIVICKNCKDATPQQPAQPDPLSMSMFASEADYLAASQPAGVVDDIERAARLVDARADAYDTDHGTTDPETGMREYPGEGLDYFAELREIADGIRALNLTVKPS